MVCLISGAASGIGLATAMRLSRRMAVVIADLEADRIDAAVEAIRLAGAEAEGVVCDVRVVDDCVRAVVAAERLGVLTDVVSSAGIVSREDGALADCAAETWDRVIGINLTGAANLVRAALPALLRSGGGDIVLVASTAALVGRPGIAAYSTSKAALIGLQRSLVADYAVRGIRCNCVCPGPTQTPMTRSANKILPNATGQMAQPDQVAAAIDWLTQDESDWMMGGTLPLDGGEVTAIAQAFARR